MTLQEKEANLFKKKYLSKVASTKGRTDKLGNPIEFLLTLEEYTQLYKDIGVLPSRSYVLSRKDDLGNYEIGNVFVQHLLNNLCDAVGKVSELDKKINEYCINNNYSRRTVKSLLKRGILSL